MSARAKSKLPLWATVCTFAGFTVLSTLGFWQLDRLSQKETLLAKISAYEAQDPSENSFGFEDFTQKNLYKRGQLSGVYKYDSAVLLTPRTYDGKTGHHLYVPLQVGERYGVLVQRGWVPKDFDLEAMSGRNVWIANVQGTIARLPQPNSFTPENTEGQRRMIYQLDLDAFAAQTGLEIAPFMLQAERSNIDVPELQRVSLTKDIRNDHLQYALFWFAMAMILLVVYYLRFLRAHRG